jgi:hypothetical protein
MDGRDSTNFFEAGGGGLSPWKKLKEENPKYT